MNSIKTTKPNEQETLNKFIQERDNEIKIIHKQSIELNELMKDLSKLVDEQGSSIRYAGRNIEYANNKTKRGLQELTQVDKTQKESQYCIIS